MEPRCNSIPAPKDPQRNKRRDFAGNVRRICHSYFGAGPSFGSWWCRKIGFSVRVMSG